jgi:hypothetical protein
LDRVVLVQHAEGIYAGLGGEPGSVNKSILKMDMRSLRQTLVSLKKNSSGVEMLTVIFQITKEDRPKIEDLLQIVTEQLSANFKSDVDKLNKSIEGGIETEVSKLNFMVTSLREENQHDIKMLILK